MSLSYTAQKNEIPSVYVVSVRRYRNFVIANIAAPSALRSGDDSDDAAPADAPEPEAEEADAEADKE